MIRVMVLYPNEPGAKFDFDYYANKHLALALDKLSPRGLVRASWNKGISSADPSAPAPFVAVGELEFSTLEEVHEAFKVVGREVMGDIPNYTNIKPQIHIGEIAS